MPSSLLWQSDIGILDRIIDLLLELCIIEVLRHSIFGINIHHHVSSIPQIKISGDLGNAIHFHLNPLVRKQFESPEIGHENERRAVELGYLVCSELLHVLFVNNFYPTKHVDEVFFYIIVLVFFSLICNHLNLPSFTWTIGCIFLKQFPMVSKIDSSTNWWHNDWCIRNFISP